MWRILIIVIIFIVNRTELSAQPVYGEIPVEIKARKENTKKYFFIRSWKKTGKLTRKVTQGLDDEDEKTAAIYTWITKNIKYDVKVWNGRKIYIAQPQKTLLKRKASCAGYSALFIKMCEHAGVEAEPVEGYYKSLYHRNDRIINSANHIWIGHPYISHYAITDPTLGAGYLTLRKQPVRRFLYNAFGIMYRAKYKFVKSFTTVYYATHPDTLRHSHHSDHPMWQYQSDTLSAAKFMQAPQETRHWVKTQNNGNEAYDFKGQIRTLKSERAKSHDLLFLAEATRENNAFNHFTMATGYLQRPKEYLAEEIYKMLKQEDKYVADTLMTDSMLVLMDSAGVWSKRIKASLRPHNVKEMDKIFSFRDENLKYNTNYRRILSKLRTSYSGTRSKMKSESSATNDVMRRIGELDRKLIRKKIPDSYAEHESDRPEKAFSEKESLQPEIDILTINLIHTEDTLKKEIAVYDSLVKVRFTLYAIDSKQRDSIANLRYRLDFRNDSLITQIGRRNLKITKEGLKIDTIISTYSKSLPAYRKNLTKNYFGVANLYKKQLNLLDKAYSSEIYSKQAKWLQLRKEHLTAARGELKELISVFEVLSDYQGRVERSSEKLDAHAKPVMKMLSGDNKALRWWARQYVDYEQKRYAIVNFVTNSEATVIKETRKSISDMGRDARTYHKKQARKSGNKR